MSADTRRSTSESRTFICCYYRYPVKEQRENLLSVSTFVYTKDAASLVRRPAYVLIEEASFAGFEWDEAKRASNWNTHEVDFEDAKLIFSRPHIVASSNRETEVRWMAVGLLSDGVEIAVVFTSRKERCRIISARRAKRYERKAYHQAIGERSKKGQN